MRPNRESRFKSLPVYCMIACLPLVSSCAGMKHPRPNPPLAEAQEAVTETLRAVETADGALAVSNSEFDRQVMEHASQPKLLAQRRRPDGAARFAFVKNMIAVRDETARRETELNKALVEGYRAAGNVPQPHRLAAETRVALYHYAALLRRQSMRSWHTSVPGLIDDPDCAGDLLRDQLLQQYGEALFREGAAARQTQFVVLVKLARQAACLSARQMNDLGKDAYGAFAELGQLYHSTGRDDVRAMMVQVLAQPFLFFYDVDKHRGAASGWYRWFAENEYLLREGLYANRQPMKWLGVWLYDRRTGRLVRFTNASVPRREGEIRLSEFWNSLAKLDRLGTGECGLAEMALRGNGQNGYWCIAKECQRTDAAERDSQSSGDELPFRLSGRLTLSKSTCEGRSGGWDSRASGAFCDRVPQLGPQSREALTVECASRQIVRPGLADMRCISEATGMCASPVDQLAKNLQMTPMTGVKMGRFCGLGKGVEGKSGQSGPFNVDRLIANIIRAIQDKQPFAFEDKQQAIDFWRETRDQAREKEEKLESEMDALIDKLGHTTDPEEQARTEKELDEKAKEWGEAAAEEQNANSNLEGLGDYVPPTGGGEGTATAHCVTEEACDDACSGMEKGMRQALACFAKSTNAEATPYTDPISGCDPQVCDPIEPAGTVTRGQCLGTDEAALLDTTPKQCWLYHCAHDEVALAQGSGCGCARRSEGTSVAAVHDFCAYARCTDEAGRLAAPAQLSGGSCGCAPGGSAPSRTDIKLESLTTPPSLLNANPAVRGLLEKGKLFDFGRTP